MTRAALVLAALLGATLTLSPDTASADDSAPEVADGAGAIQLRPSFRYERSVANSERLHGFGLNLELRVYPSAAAWRYGAFVSGDLMLDGTQRYAAGFSGGYGLFGIELGVAQRTASDRFAASTGLHLGKTFTLGPVGIALRMTIPLASQRGGQDELEARGFEHAFRISLGWSFDLAGSRPAMSMCHHGSHGAHGSH